MSGPAQNIHNIYDPLWEHDACGIGAVVNLKGTPSHATVDSALKIVEKLEHRAGKDAAGETGDGVGLMIQVPHKLMVKTASAEGIALGGPRDYGVGMFFFPADALKRAQAQKMLEIIASKEGLDFLGWRDVPTHPEVLGRKALDCMPCICQCFVARPVDCARGLDFDRKLYVVRREFEQSNVNTYICSFSSRTIVYKGMFLVGQLRKFYTDLTEPDCESAIALVHSRFSTNTTPSWERAHPNRYILHNGEINTIRGNVDRMLAREVTMHSAVLEADMDKILPVVDQSGSDSAMLDNTLEFLMMNGIPLPQAVMMCIPEPWANDRKMSREKRDFYHYYATMMEPWDGPAAIVFSDGDTVGAVLDRNGLRPCRWYLTTDKQLILSSEVGVLDIPPEKIVKKSRLQPGRMLLADLRVGEGCGMDDNVRALCGDEVAHGGLVGGTQKIGRKGGKLEPAAPHLQNARAYEAACAGHENLFHRIVTSPDKEQFQHKDDGTAGHRHLKQAGPVPCRSDAHHQRCRTGHRALGGVDDGREGHDRQRDVGDIVEEGLDELIPDGLADEGQGQDADGVGHREHHRDIKPVAADHCSASSLWVLMGNSSAPAQEIATVRRMVRVPSERAEMPGR